MTVTIFRCKAWSTVLLTCLLFSAANAYTADTYVQRMLACLLLTEISVSTSAYMPACSFVLRMPWEAATCCPHGSLPTLGGHAATCRKSLDEHAASADHHCWVMTTRAGPAQ